MTPLNIGDIVEIIRVDNPQWTALLGHVTEIIDMHVIHGRVWYLVPITLPGWACATGTWDCFRKLDDGNEPGSWDDCIWKPSELVKIHND